MNSHLIAVAVLWAAVTPSAHSHAEVVRRLGIVNATGGRQLTVRALNAASITLNP